MDIGDGDRTGGNGNPRFLLSPLFLIINVLTLILWVVSTDTRIIIQKKASFYRSKTGGAFPESKGPTINWDLLSEPIYADAIGDWVEEVRVVGNLTTNESAWAKHFKRAEKLIERRKLSAVSGPNHQKMKALEELMELE